MGWHCCCVCVLGHCFSTWVAGDGVALCAMFQTSHLVPLVTGEEIVQGMDE